MCEPDRPLSWDDFQGATKKKDAKHGATTALSFPEATSAPDVTFKVVFHPEHASAKAGAKDPANRKQTGCAKRIKKCKKALTDHPGGWYGLSGEPNPNCHASPVPDSAIRATTKAACKSNIGAECDRVAALESERLLRHEQLHFDTGCVLVKKANAAIAAGTDATTAHEALEKSFVSVSKDYDGVTNNGCDAEQQAAWETKVGEGLPEVTIP